MTCTLRALTLLALVGLVGCEREHVARYTTRGLVLQREGQGEEERVAIQHEAIPQFEDRDGKTAPMHSMTMIFGLGPRLARSSLVPQQKVRFEFEVRWTEAPFLTLTRVESLPDDTALQLSATHGEP